MIKHCVISVAFYNKIPLGTSAERSLFWGFAATILRLPPVFKNYFIKIVILVGNYDGSFSKHVSLPVHKD